MQSKLLDDVFALPPHERVAFAELILASIDREDDEIRRAWMDEVKKRMKSVAAGKSKLLDFEKLYRED